MSLIYSILQTIFGFMSLGAQFHDMMSCYKLCFQVEFKILYMVLCHVKMFNLEFNRIDVFFLWFVTTKDWCKQHLSNIWKSLISSHLNHQERPFDTSKGQGVASYRKDNESSTCARQSPGVFGWPCINWYRICRSSIWCGLPAFGGKTRQLLSAFTRSTCSPPHQSKIKVNRS